MNPSVSGTYAETGTLGRIRVLHKMQECIIIEHRNIGLTRFRKQMKRFIV